MELTIWLLDLLICVSVTAVSSRELLAKNHVKDFTETTPQIIQALLPSTSDLVPRPRENSDPSGGTDPILGKDSLHEKSSGNKRRHRNKQKTNKIHRSGSIHKSCCMNGGLCVLGSFCHCKKRFYGRYCEYEKSSRSCGPVKHEEVFRKGCMLCRCIDAILTCLPHIYGDCDGQQTGPIFHQFHATKKPEVVKHSEIEKIDEEIVKILDSYKSKNSGSDTTGNNGSGATQRTLSTYVLILVVQIIILF